MSGFCYITDGRESYFDIAFKFIKSTKFKKVEDLAENMHRWNSFVSNKRNTRDMKSCIPCSDYLLYVPARRITGYNDPGLNKVKKICYEYGYGSIAGRESLRNIREKQEKGIDVLAYIFSHYASVFHNENVRKKFEEFKRGQMTISTAEAYAENHKKEQVEKANEHLAEMVEKIGEGTHKLVHWENCAFNSKNIKWAESFDEISKSMTKVQLKLNSVQKNVDFLKKFKGNAQVEEKIAKLKDELLACVKESEELSKKEIKRATRCFLKVKVDINSAEIAEDILGKGRAILIECFEHPKVLKVLSFVSKGFEIIAPAVEFVSDAIKVIDTYKNGGDWKAETVKEASKFIVVVGIGGYIFGALICAGISFGWIIIAGIAIGYGLELMGEWISDEMEKLYKSGIIPKVLQEWGAYIISNPNMAYAY